MQAGSYALALYRILRDLEIVFFDDCAYTMNFINASLQHDIYEDMNEGEVDDIFDKNAFRLGWKLALGEPFDSDTQHLDQLCSSIKDARSLFPKHEDGFIKLSSSDDEG